MADAFDKSRVVVGEVEVRLARPDERRRWDALMDRHHSWGSGSSRAGGCATSRCGAGTGSRSWAGSRGRQVRPTRPVAGLAPLGAVPAPASDWEQHAVSDSARGAGDSEPGLAGAGAQPSAGECGLGGGVGPSAGARRDVRGRRALPRRCVRCLELGAGGTIALAIVFHRGFHHLPDAQMHFMMRRDDALDALLSPT